MAPQYGHGNHRTALHAAHTRGGAPRHISSANSTQLGHQGHRTQGGDRARETQRKRNLHERRTETVVGRSPSPAVPLNRPSRLVDRMTYGHSGEVQGPIDRGGGDSPRPRTQQGRSLQNRITHDDDFSGDGGPVQPVSERRDQRGHAMRTNTDYDSNGMDVGGYVDQMYNTPAASPLLNPSASTPRTTWQPVNTEQYSSHHAPFNQNLQPPRPIQPATRAEPRQEVPAEPKRPVNTYKGNNVVKRLVQNDRLRRVLSGRPMPRPRKQPDRMNLRCAGQQVLR